MIYRVGDNEITTYDRSTIKAPQPKSGGEKFDLNQYVDDKTGDKKKEEKKANEAEGMGGVTQKSGVKLELSGSQKAALSPSKISSAAESTQAAGSLLETVRDFFAKFIAACKDILYRIWNDPPSEGENAGTADAQSVEESKGVDVEGEEAERITEEYRRMKGMDYVHVPDTQVPPKTDKERDMEIRKYLHTGNLNQVLDILTDNGQRTMAKNSTLLTYYDKSGKIAEINASDRERILHGDRNVREL